MRILIVDDSESVRLLFEVWLKAAGYPEVLTAASADDAFEHLATDDPTSSDAGVDLILMDVAMPEMDGIDACRRIKSDPRFQNIPIIVVTAQDELNHLEDAFAAGATDFITKSVKQAELLARVRSALTLKHEMDSHRRACTELEKKNRALEEALNKVFQLLSGLSPILSFCENALIDDGEWGQFETQIARHSPAGFTHAVDSECIEESYPGSDR